MALQHARTFPHCPCGNGVFGLSNVYAGENDQDWWKAFEGIGEGWARYKTKATIFRVGIWTRTTDGEEQHEYSCSCHAVLIEGWRHSSPGIDFEVMLHGWDGCPCCISLTSMT